MKLVIKQGTHGRGVFTEEPIAAGTFIIPFTGPFLHYKDTTPETYALQIGPDLYVGASGNFDDYVNHSCEPNCGLKIDGTTVKLHAIRDIQPGEELFFDYSTTMDEDDFEMTCWCGKPSCRKTVRDAKHLPEETWQKYLKLGILPDYVRKHRPQK
jgi:SET domain-containing protein